MNSLETIFEDLQRAQKELALTGGSAKKRALQAAADMLEAEYASILAANACDVDRARRQGMKEPLVERLLLTQPRIAEMAAAVRIIAALDDPAGKVKAGWTRPNGLFIEEVTVPLGVVAIIYESRPNVTVDAFALAYKTGCAILLRGSQAAKDSNLALVAALKQGLARSGGVCGALAIATGGHDEVDKILHARGKIDAVLPRGGHELIRKVVEEARIPVIETGEGNCHIYVEASAVMNDAVRIIDNAKTQRPGACNAVETLLVEEAALAELVPLLAGTFAGRVELHCDSRALSAFASCSVQGLITTAASEADWSTEYLDFILAVKTVDSLDEAISHINRYGTGHSEAILTGNLTHAEQFRREVNAACVYVNASTRFTDGGEFGFGAELGISTQKFHARGPMGLSALTTSKYLISGAGQIRN
ncbi:MAG: glutamate-5-semialdehyde dehydrogenase [Spirochaetaceae bacterium]|jgi:glutamate-5-semialdehyde dehydrogenase|nr:glutamate-5-semialdehyde dehydrogenase [Spirochaetaceae bacterium]